MIVFFPSASVILHSIRETYLRITSNTQQWLSNLWFEWSAAQETQNFKRKEMMCVPWWKKSSRRFQSVCKPFFVGFSLRGVDFSSFCYSHPQIQDQAYTGLRIHVPSICLFEGTERIAKLWNGRVTEHAQTNVLKKLNKSSMFPSGNSVLWTISSFGWVIDSSLNAYHYTKGNTHLPEHNWAKLHFVQKLMSTINR